MKNKKIAHSYIKLCYKYVFPSREPEFTPRFTLGLVMLNL